MKEKPKFGICKISGKVKYDKKGAISAMNQRYKQDHVLLRAYVCPDCNCWHLTRRQVLSTDINNYGKKPKTKSSFKERRREYYPNRNFGTKYRRSSASHEEDQLDTHEERIDSNSFERGERSIESGDTQSIGITRNDRTIILKTESKINTMISTIAQIVFFAVYGINYFFPFKVAGVIMAIAALVIAIVLIANQK